MPVVAGDAAAGVEVVEEDVRWRFLEEEEDRAAAEPVAVAGAGDAGPSVFSSPSSFLFLLLPLLLLLLLLLHFSDLPVSGAGPEAPKHPRTWGARA